MALSRRVVVHGGLAMSAVGILTACGQSAPPASAPEPSDTGAPARNKAMEEAGVWPREPSDGADVGSAIGRIAAGALLSGVGYILRQPGLVNAGGTLTATGLGELVDAFVNFDDEAVVPPDVLPPLASMGSNTNRVLLPSPGGQTEMPPTGQIIDIAVIRTDTDRALEGHWVVVVETPDGEVVAPALTGVIPARSIFEMKSPFLVGAYNKGLYKTRVELLKPKPDGVLPESADIIVHGPSVFYSDASRFDELLTGWEKRQVNGDAFFPGSAFG